MEVFNHEFYGKKSRAMNKSFYLRGSEKVGPFTIEERTARAIRLPTTARHRTFEDWTPAAKIEELKGWFNLAPPDIKPPSSPSAPSGGNYKAEGSRGVMPKKWLIESILATLFCCLPFGIAGIVNAANVESRFN